MLTKVIFKGAVEKNLVEIDNAFLLLCDLGRMIETSYKLSHTGFVKMKLIMMIYLLQAVKRSCLSY